MRGVRLDSGFANFRNGCCRMKHFFFVILNQRNTTQHCKFTGRCRRLFNLLLPAAALCLTLVSPRPSPNSGTGRLGIQARASLDSEAQGSRWWQLNTVPTTSITTICNSYRYIQEHQFQNETFQEIANSAQQTLTLRGFSLRYGGSPSTISIAMMPRDQMSTFGPYAFLVTTSGAIQYGVPTMVLRLLCSGVIWAQKPKSAAGERKNLLFRTFNKRKTKK